MRGVEQKLIDFGFENERGSKALKFFLVLTFVLDARFACLFTLPGIFGKWTSTNWSKELVCILAIVVLICYIVRYRRIVGRLYSFLPAYLAVLLIVCFVEVIYSMNAMGSPLSAAVKASEIAYFVLALPLLVQMIVDRSYKPMLNALLAISVVCAVALLLQGTVYAVNGSILFSAMTNSTGDETVVLRDFGIRFSPPGGLMSISALFAAAMVFFEGNDRKNRKWYLTSLTVIVSALIFVYQTRAEDIALIGSIILSVLVYTKSGRLSHGLKRFLIVAVAILILASGVFGGFIDSFSSTNQIYGGSTTIRLYEYSYYFDLFLQYPLFGIGSLPSTSMLLNGNGSAYISDVGVVGMMAQWGLLFVVLFVAFVVRLIQIYSSLKSSASVMELSLMLSIILYIFFTSATLVCFSAALGIRVVFALALFEFLNYKYSKVGRAQDV